MSERVARVKREVSAGGSYFAAPKTDVSFISSGSKLLDLALGGGWAESRVSNIIGDKSTGKTLIAIEACANFARKYKKGKIKYSEAEAAFLPSYAKALNMPVDRVDFNDPGAPFETIEHLFDDINSYIQKAKKTPTLYICDSLDALSDAAELERDFGEGSFGTQKAKDISKLFRLLIREMSRSELTLMIISQIRSKIGFMTRGETTSRSGGRALDFYASQVVRLIQMGKLEKTRAKIKRVTGIKIHAKVEKNKIGTPFREADFLINFGLGIDDIQACVDWLKLAGMTVNGMDPKTLNSLTDEEYRTCIEDLYGVVERKWYDIEEGFLPKRKKYDAYPDIKSTQ